jgi:hypothetical protein
MRNLHSKFHEFDMQRKVDMNLLSLFSFSEICTIGEQESRRFEYTTMKICFNGFQKKNSYFCELYFIFYKFPKFMHEQVKTRGLAVGSSSLQFHGHGVGAGHACIVSCRAGCSDSCSGRRRVAHRRLREMTKEEGRSFRRR